MKQVFSGTSFGNMDGATTYYYPITSFIGTNPGITEANVDLPISTSGTFRNLRIKLSTAPSGAGKTRTFTLRKNGVDQTITTVITNTAVDGTDFVNSFTAAAGDTVSIKEVPSGTPSNSRASISIEFESDTAKRNIVGGIYLFTSATVTNYFSLVGNTVSGSTTVADWETIIPHGTTLKSLYYKLSAAPGVGKSYEISLYVNGTRDAGTSVTVSGAATTGNITGLSVNLVAGDRVALRIVPSGTPTTGNMVYGFEFQSDTDGESIFLGTTSTNNLSNSATRWLGVNTAASPDSTEANIAGICGPTSFVLKNLYLNFRASPGSGKSYAITARKSGASQALTSTVADLNTTGNDTSNSVTYVDQDTLGLTVVPSGTPTATGVRFGITQYIAPAVTTVFTKIIQTMNQAVKQASTY
jgi:hypothetical protein